MNAADVETFRRQAREIYRRYEISLAELEQDYARQAGVTWDATKGSGRGIALEAHARQYALDPVLGALAWTLTDATRMVIEDGVSPTAAQPDGHRRRLDYHGRENPDGRSLLVVEAKRPNLVLPAADERRVQEALSGALVALNAGGANNSLPVDWSQILQSCVDYVRRVKASHGDAPRTFAISNGEWFVVFKDVEATLLAGQPATDQIAVFETPDDIYARADAFCAALSYVGLSGHVPLQAPEALPDFIPTDREALCVRVLDVFYGRHGERQPVLSVCVGMYVRTLSGAWILFRSGYPDDFVILSADEVHLGMCRVELERRATDLFETLVARRQIRYASREEFEASPPHRTNTRVPVRPSWPLAQELSQDRFRFVTLNHVLYFVADDGFDACPYHNWGLCRTAGHAFGDVAVTEQSAERRCFFPSGHRYHCSHAAIGARRQTCLLLPFEQYFCCRCCVYLTKCWPDPAAMPCG